MTHRLPKNTLALALALLGLVLGLVSFQSAQQQPRKRNLQVLPQNISHDSLDMLMDEYCAALNVKCGFCHMQRESDPKRLDFSKDGKPEKDICRSMIRMTGEINKNYFNFIQSTRPDTITAVKCATCHRGSARPEGLETFMPKEH